MEGGGADRHGQCEALGGARPSGAARESITVLPEDALHADFDLGAGAFADGPIDRHVFPNLGDQLGGDDFEFVSCSQRLSELPMASTALLFTASAS